MLLARPDKHEWWNKVETINDADGMVANFWRSLQQAPETVAQYADGPVNECDMHASHVWLRTQAIDLELPRRLEGNPEYFDAQIAGRWAKGMSEWIGSGWCGPSGAGPWTVDSEGRFLKQGRGIKRSMPRGGNGVHRSMPRLGDAGTGVNRTLGLTGAGIKRSMPHLSSSQGVARSVVLSGDGVPDVIGGYRDHLTGYFCALANRLRRVRVVCGDWSRICGPSPTTNLGLTGVFLDPPYSSAVRDNDCYATDTDCAAEVREWCLQRGGDPLFRIALCGYDNEGHAEPMAEAGWTAVPWKANGGYSSIGNSRGRENASREVIWFSPHCLRPKSKAAPATTLFDDEEAKTSEAEQL
jgi:hypothetical protein